MRPHHFSASPGTVSIGWLPSAVSVFASLLFIACAAQGPGVLSETVEVPGQRLDRAAVVEVLDRMHAASAAADEAAYFAAFTEDAIFIGTDETERWDMEAFREYAHPHFSQGRGWAFDVVERHIMPSDDGRIAWFDERLRSEKYGALRGSGVVIKGADGHRVAHYVLSLPIPNEAASEVVGVVKRLEEASP